jgi:hypothetical protein
MAAVMTVTVTAAAGREGRPALWTETRLVAGETRLRFLDVGNGIAAQPERIMGAGLAGRLSGGRGDDACNCEQAERNGPDQP